MDTLSVIVRPKPNMTNTKIFLLFFYSLTFGFTFGQTNETSKTFNSKIKDLVKDSSSQFYYPTLLNKIKSQPNSITKEEIYYLYYGQLFQTKRKGLTFVDNPEYGDFMKNIVGKKCNKAIPLGYKILNRSPVQLTTLLHTNICLKDAEQKDTMNLTNRYQLLLDAILSTGDGSTKETAIKIANSEDDEIIKGAMGFLGGQEMLDTGNNKAFSVWTKDGKKLYFEDIWAYE